jgi:hypothetical protein
VNSEGVRYSRRRGYDVEAIGFEPFWPAGDLVIRKRPFRPAVRGADQGLQRGVPSGETTALKRRQHRRWPRRVRLYGCGIELVIVQTLGQYTCRTSCDEADSNRTMEALHDRSRRFGNGRDSRQLARIIREGADFDASAS